MELTRRDAVAALAAIGGAGAVAVGYRHHSGGDSSNGSPETDLLGDDRVIETMVAVAEVVYPTGVTDVEPFVEEFVGQRLDENDGHARGIREMATRLDGLSESWHGDRVTSLPTETRDRLLDEVGADTAAEVPDGTTAERVRYFVVNELLLALYASPTGGRLVGIENPQGHPGGTDSYQRGPNRNGNSFQQGLPAARW